MARKKSTPPRLKPPRWRNAWLWPAALVGLTFAAYFSALTAGFIWDDPDYVINNATLRSMAGLRQIWTAPQSLPQYYPLVHTTFWAEYQLWGLWAPGYHAVNVAIHAMAAVLLWRVLVALGVPGAWVAAALFAVHPVQVESVAWITERKNVLSAAFYFAALLAYLRWRNPGESPPRDLANFARRWPWYVASLGLFVPALLSKTVACSMPAVVLLIIWWKRGRLGWRDLLPLLPFFAIGLKLALLTSSLERGHVGAAGAEWDLSPLDRLLIAGRAVWFYAWKLLLPFNLSFVYPRWEIDSTSAWQYAFPAAAVALVASLWLLRYRIGRGPLAAVLAFGGTLLPALGFFNLYPMRYTFVADHYQYHASAFLLALLSGAATWWVRDRKRLRLPAIVLGTGFVLCCTLLSFTRARAFLDSETLWRDTLAKNPGSWMVHTNLAHALAARGKLDEAAGHYRAALRLAPDLPETHTDVAEILADQGDTAAALAEYRAALEYEPQFPLAHLGLGKLHAAAGRRDEAVASFERALAANPGLIEARVWLARLLRDHGDLAAAAAQLREALARRDDGPAHLELANCLLEMKQFNEAAIHYAWFVRQNPDHARAVLSLGEALFWSGRVAESIPVYRRAVALDPTLAPARIALDRAMRAHRPDQSSP